MSRRYNKLFRVHYRDRHDGGAPVFTMTMRAPNETFVDDTFYEHYEPEGWKLVKIEEINENGSPKRGARRR